MRAVSLSRFRQRGGVNLGPHSNVLSPNPAFVLGIVAAAAAAVVIVRRPDAFTNPQFYAEDGADWFSDAYNHGPWRSLWIAYNGYYELLPRLTALIAAPFGPAKAPLVYNLVGLLVQIAPVVVFASKRFETLVPSLLARLAVGAAYLLIPSMELNVTITNALWHLAIVAVLVTIAPAPTNRAWKAFDVVVVALCALSGPFAYILFPAAVLWWFISRRRWTLLLACVLAAGLAVQLYALSVSPRQHPDVGASLRDFFLIVCDRIVLAGLFAEEGHAHVFVASVPHSTLLAAGICLLALPIVVYAALRAPWELRVFALVGLAVVAAGLALPLGPPGKAWGDYAFSNSGERYFFMAQVAWVLALVWAASQIPARWVKRAVWSATAAGLLSGAIAEWSYPAFVDYGWAQEASHISAAQPGTRLVLTIPPGPPWAVDVTVR
jgi:hypothetical protein